MQITRMNGQMHISNSQNTNNRQRNYQTNFGMKFVASGDEILKVCPDWAEGAVNGIKELNQIFDKIIIKKVCQKAEELRKSKFYYQVINKVFKGEKVSLPVDEVTNLEFTQQVISGFNETKIPMQFDNVEGKNLIRVYAKDVKFAAPGKAVCANSEDNLKILITDGYDDIANSIVEQSKLTDIESEIKTLELNDKIAKKTAFQDSIKGKMIE